MTTIEDRLRDALTERAKHAPIDPDAWERTRTRSFVARETRFGWRWHRPGRFLIPATAAVAVIAIIMGVTAAVNGITGRSSGEPAGARSATPAATKPAPAASRSGPNPNGVLGQLLPNHPAVSAILIFSVKAPARRTAVAYSWLGYTSPYAWLDQLQGLQSCTVVAYPQGEGSGGCVPFPQLGADDPARVTDSTYLGASAGPLVLQGLAVNRVTSVTAVLPDGQDIAGTVKTGRGFPDRAWAVVTPANEATDKPVSGIRLVFRDASGSEVATLSTAAPSGSPVAQPSSGGILAFHLPGQPTGYGDVSAYLIDGYVGFFLRRALGPTGWMAPQLATGQPALAGLSNLFLVGSKTDRGFRLEAFGYAHADVARVVLRMSGLGNGGPVSTSTFAAWPGGGLRLWAVPLWQGTTVREYGTLVITATGYDAAGQAVAHVKLGQSD
jgi:hypothetical protein